MHNLCYAHAEQQLRQLALRPDLVLLVMMHLRLACLWPDMLRSPIWRHLLLLRAVIAHENGTRVRGHGFTFVASAVEQTLELAAWSRVVPHRLCRCPTCSLPALPFALPPFGHKSFRHSGPCTTFFPPAFPPRLRSGLAGPHV